MAHIKHSQLISAPPFEVFDYVTNPKNQTFLLQPYIDVELLSHQDGLKRGDEIHFNMARFGLTQSIRFRVEDILRGSRLTYRQCEGIFANWTHTMKFEEHQENKTLITDLVDYQVPMGILGHLMDDLLIKGDMGKILEKRLLKVQEHFQA